MAFKKIPGRKVYPEWIRQLIDEEWQKGLACGKNLWDGPVWSLVDYHDHCFVVQETGYRDFYGTNTCHGDNPEIRKMAANSLAVCIAVETACGKFVAGLRNPMLGEFGGFWHVPGGNLEQLTADAAFDCARAELLEELGITRNDYRQLVCTGLIQNDLNGKPEFVFYARIDLDMMELKERIAGACDAVEHIDMQYLRAEEIGGFIAGNSFSPAGVAALELALEYRLTGPDYTPQR